MFSLQSFTVASTEVLCHKIVLRVLCLFVAMFHWKKMNASVFAKNIKGMNQKVSV